MSFLVNFILEESVWCVLNKDGKKSSFIIRLAPIGIFCLLAGQILEIKDLETSFVKAGWFVVTVLVGLLVHGLVVLPGLYFLISGTHPYKIMRNSVQALLTAFGTSSRYVPIRNSL